MKNLILGAILLICAANSNAQLIVDDSIQLKRGIYNSFEEFKNNAPSILTDFEIEEKIRLSKNYSYRLVFRGEKIEEKEIWGVCDGNFIYKKQEDAFNIGRPLYDKFLLLGRYCFYELYERGYYIPGGIKRSSAYKLPSKREVVLNINNGNVYLVNKQSMKTILKQDPSIYNEYLTDKKRKKNYRHYIKVYNDKHKDEIKK